MSLNEKLFHFRNILGERLDLRFHPLDNIFQINYFEPLPPCNSMLREHDLEYETCLVAH